MGRLADHLTADRRRSRRFAHRDALVVIVIAVVAGVGIGIHGATAGPVGGLGVTVQADNPSAATVTLTNNTGASCQVVTTALGAIVLTDVRQGGDEIAPIPLSVSFDDAIDTMLRSRSRTLENGRTVTIRLPIVPAGPTGHGLESVTWSSSGVAIGSLFPISASGRLQIRLRYAPPFRPTSGSPPCPHATNADPGVPDSRLTPSRRNTIGLVIGIGAGSVILLGVLLVLARRRRRGPRAGTVLVVIALAAGFAPLIGRTRPASATITVAPELQKAYSDCTSQFAGDPGHLLPGLNAPGVSVQIVPANGDQTHEGSLNSKTILIFWDPNDRHAYTGGGNADPCTSLYHEFNHAHEDTQGTQSHDPCVTAGGDSGIPINEVNATRVQNQLRVQLGMPARKTYGDKVLPDSPCLPKDKQPKAPPKNCTGAGCGDTNGDPHLRSFDGRRYDFQAAGEFVAARSADRAFEVQVRQEPFLGSRSIAVNTAVAVMVAGTRVEMRLGATGMIVVIGGHAAPAVDAALPTGGTIAFTSDRSPTAVITWPDGSAATVAPIGPWGLHLAVQPSKSMETKLSGLLGDFDTNPDNDLRTKTGELIAGSPFDALYPGFADSWRVTAATSLFSYEKGTSTATYTDRSFPDLRAAPQNDPGYARAEALCRDSGVTDREVLENCAFDVTLTGQPEFAVAAVASQVASGSTGAAPVLVPVSLPPPPVGASSTLIGRDATLRVDKPGGTARLSFAADGGSKVFVDITSSDLANGCGILTLRDPSGKSLNGACLSAGTGFIDATSLPVAGEYVIELTPPNRATGSLHLKIVVVTDTTSAITENGPSVTARVTGPGAIAELTFNATAGQNIFIDIPTSTIADDCGVVTLLAPDGKTLNTACLIRGTGYVDATRLQADGRYTIRIDPRDRHVGTASLRIISVNDTVGALTLNGPPVTATITGPGATAELTFAAIAGQNIFVDIPTSTIADDCGVVTLLAPDGKTLNTACIIRGTGYVDATRLQADGRYTIRIDPRDRHVGTASLRIISITNTTAAITPNGPPITVTIGEPGAIAELSFTGTAGQSVAIVASDSTLGNACGVIRLLDPGNKTIVDGCILGGKGGIDRTKLATSGRYSVVIDPPERSTGSAVIRLQ